MDTKLMDVLLAPQVIALAAGIIALLFGLGKIPMRKERLGTNKVWRKMERAANLERIKALEADLYDLRDQVDSLDAEPKASAEEREEVHDAIDNAGSIDDVDRILRSGIPGVSGRRDR